jgi:lipoyl-dependent peroxiredoxin
MMKKTASAHWQGGIKDGKGSISTESGALNQQPYGFNTRFENQPGTNPEELLGAAHAGCFSMALSKELGAAAMTAESIDTQAEVTLEKQDGGFAITAVHLILQAKIPGAERAAFEKAVANAKSGCPLSKVLNAEITLEAVLDS